MEVTCQGLHGGVGDSPPETEDQSCRGGHDGRCIGEVEEPPVRDVGTVDEASYLADFGMLEEVQAATGGAVEQVEVVEQ